MSNTELSEKLLKIVQEGTLTEAQMELLSGAGMVLCYSDKIVEMYLEANRPFFSKLAIAALFS